MRVGIGSSTITAEDKERVLSVLDSGRLSAGPVTGDFEARFAALHGCHSAALCNSGTGALQLSLQALRQRHTWPKGSEVIVPAVTFVASINVILYNELVPVLADVDPLTYTIDPDQVEAQITPRTVAIMPVHLFGQPADMTALMALAAKHRLRVIEDSCEAVAVRHHGRPVGSFGDFACFSTYMAHIVTTGVGGLALTNDDDLAMRFRSLMNHGRDPRYLRIDDDEGLDDDSLLEVVWSRYRFTNLGQSFRVTEIEAALGIGQLDRLDAILSQRAHVADMLRLALANPALQLPHVAEGNEHAYMMFPIVCHEVGLRDRLMIALERAGVETRLMLPILGQPCYSDVLPPGDYPVAELIGERGFYIGCHQDITESDVAYIAETIGEAMH